MPAIRTFFDAKFHEYLFDVLVNLNPNQKAKLNDGERAKIRNRTEIQRFLSLSSLEAKLALLTKTHINWCILFWEDGNLCKEDLQRVYSQFETEGEVLEIINDMLHKKYFAISAKQVALSLAMLDSNSHGEAWSINKQFIAALDDLHETQEKFAQRNNAVEFVTTTKAMRRVNRLSLALDLLWDYGEAVHGLQPCDMAILRVLFTNPNSFYREDVVQKKLRTLFKPATVAKRCRKLQMEGYLERAPSPATTRKPAFQIMQKGILVVGDFLNKAVNQAMGEL